MLSAEQAALQERTESSLPKTGRPVIRSNQGVVSSGHYLTSMAGAKLLINGGNAFDALAASVFAAAVVEPIASYSLAAEAVLMIYSTEEDSFLSVSGQGTAPELATIDFYKSKGLDVIPTGVGKDAPLAFTLPGVVDSLLTMLERFGTKKISEVLEPAIKYASEGIPHYEYMLDRLDSASTVQQFELFPPGGFEVFYNDKTIPNPGDLLKQSNLGELLLKMTFAEEDSLMGRNMPLDEARIVGIQAARKCFYQGEIADMFDRSSKSVGGILSKDDLGNYHAKIADPVSINFHGYEIFTHDTWSQSPVLLQALNMLEGFDLKSMGHNSAEYIHTVSECLKISLSDREAFYGDPEFSDIPIDGLLSKEYADVRRKEFNPEVAIPVQPTPGDPWAFSKYDKPDHFPESQKSSVSEDENNTHPDGTTHISVIDESGNFACATPSGGSFSKSVFFPELGCALSTRIEMFNLIEGHPNQIIPSKRPRTTLVNYIVAKDGKPVMTIGCPGGDHQAQACTELILNTLIFGMDPQLAVEVPRFATDSVVDSFYPHVYFPGRLSLETGISEDISKELELKGHKIDRAVSCGMGATVSLKDPNSGSLSTGADPRRACYAIGL